MTAHINTNWLDRYTENENLQDKRDHPDQLPKGVASKHRKKSKIMNFSLHLQAIFTSVRQNKATSKGVKRPRQIHRSGTEHLLVMYLNSTTVELFVRRGVLHTPETQSMHIYIYTYIQGCEVAECHTHASCLCTWLWFLSSVLGGPRAPTCSPTAASLQLSSGSASRKRHGWERLMHR